MRRFTIVLVGLFALALAAASVAEAGGRGLHPVRGWNGNQYLFEVQPQGDIVQLVVYRAIGHRWQRVGATRVDRAQSAPAHGWMQQVWFHGRDLGHVEADMSNPFWRYFPAEDSGGIWDN